MKGASGAAAILLVISSTVAEAAPPGDMREAGPALLESIAEVREALGEVRAYSLREPGIVAPAQIEEMLTDARDVYRRAKTLAPERQAMIAEALSFDAETLREGARERDPHGALLALDSGRRNLALMADSGGGDRSDGLVLVTVFTLRGEARVGGYTVDAHRSRRPSQLQPFNGITKAGVPTAWQNLAPGDYNFIARSGDRSFQRVQTIGGPGISTQPVYVPVE